MRDVQCGKVVIRDGLALAPMAGVTDRSFRRVCRRFGAAYTVSEMVSAKALCLEQAIRNPDPSRIISGELASVMPDEMPMAVQLFGHEPDVMAEAAARLASGDTSFLPPWISIWAVPSAKLSETGKAAP